MTTWLRVGKWFFFSVCIALIPILFSFIVLRMQHLRADLIAVIGRGELLILVSALCAAAMGDLLTSDAASRGAKLVCGGSNLLILLLSSLLFAAIVGTSKDISTLDMPLVRDISLWLFLFALITCGSSVAVAKA